LEFRRVLFRSESGSAKPHVCQEDQEQYKEHANQTHPPLDSTRFTEGHRVIDRLAVAPLSTRCSVVRSTKKFKPMRPKFLILAIALSGGVGLSLLPVSWQIIG